MSVSLFMENFKQIFDADFSRVLHVGPEYRNHRGGIGAVIATYMAYNKNLLFIPSYNGRFNKFLNLFVFIQAVIKISYTLFNDKRIEIIHIHSACYGSFYRKYIIFILVKYFFKRKSVYHLHGGAFHNFYHNGSKLTKVLINDLAAKVDLFICLSTFWKEFITNNFFVKNLIVLNNPIENVDGKMNCESYKQSKLKLLYLGRICDNKGVFDLLEVVLENKLRWSNKLSIEVGGFGEVDRFNSFITDNSLQNIVCYVGWVDGQKKSKLLSESHVLILPSYHEGLPISILEAMIRSKPILATSVGGIPSIVQNRNNGFLVNPGDKIGLTNSIDSLLTMNIEEREKMGNESFKLAQPFLIDKVFQNLEKEYDKLGISK